MRTVTYRLVDLLHATINLGFRGENEHTRIIFDAKKAFEDYPSAIPSLAVTPPQGDSYPAVCVRDGDLVYWDVLDSDVAYDGSGEGQLTFTVNNVVAKNYVFKTKISRSIFPTGEAPSVIDDWILRANAALGAIPQAIADALEEAKASGEFDGEDGVGIDRITLNSDYTLTIYLTDGSSYTTESIRGAKGNDGYSPSASVSKSGKVATITITDKNGTTSAEIMDGADGSDVIDDTAGAGDTDKTFSADKLTSEFSSVLNALSKSTENTNIAISAHQKHSLFWFNGSLHIALADIAVGDTITTEGQTPNASEVTIDEALIKDIQVNGTSILDAQGVANIPKIPSDGSGLGLAKIAYAYGTMATNDGTIGIYAAGDAQVKAGTSQYRALTPSEQNVAVFYGLAKLAGANMANLSGETIGVYPEAQKSAISQMLNGAVSVSGTTPVITAKSGIRYICGECATLDITAPESGIVDIVFESGSTPTVLTVMPPTGITAVKWANGFDPSSLEANTKYEISIMDGELGAALSWT